MLAQNAIIRKMDIDGLRELKTAETDFGSASSPFDPNDISSARTHLTANDHEPVRGQIYTVAHGRLIKDIRDALVERAAPRVNSSGTGQNDDFGSMTGLTADVWRNGYRGKIDNVMVVDDNNIEIDSSDDAVASVFAQESLICVEDSIMKNETQRVPDFGEGANIMHMRQRYAFGLRRPDVFSALITSDASAPS